MARTCTVCRHAERREINRALVDGASARDIAARFRLSSSSVDRHRREHVPKTMAKAKEADDLEEGLSLMAQLRELNAATREVLTAAQASIKNPGKGECSNCVGGAAMALKAISRLERQLELQARLCGELVRDTSGELGPGVESKAWQDVLRAVMDALAPYPEARQAVADALGADLDPS